jgi:hypothetical protein
MTASRFERPPRTSQDVVAVSERIGRTADLHWFTKWLGDDG